MLNDLRGVRTILSFLNKWGKIAFIYECIFDYVIMREEIDLPDDVMDKLAADVERELGPDIDDFLKSCKGKNFSYRERGTLRLRQKFGERLLAKAAEVEGTLPLKKKMPPM